MSYSKTHQRFADNLRDQRAISHPEDFLGPNWKDVLNFWIYLDTLSVKQLEKAIDIYEAEALDYPVYHHLFIGIASDETIGRDNSSNAFIAAGGLGLYAVGANFATYELIGSHKILEQGKLLTFVPIFLNL